MKYAKGGGNLVHVELIPSIRWLEDITVAPEVLLDAARTIPRLRRRLEIMTDIESAGLRRNGSLGLNVLLNLAVNYDALTGQPAVDITRFLVEQGADASRYERSSGDDWVVAFNPAAVRRATVIRAADAASLPYDFPPLRHQRDAVAAISQQGATTSSASQPPASPRRPRP